MQWKFHMLMLHQSVWYLFPCYRSSLSSHCGYSIIDIRYANIWLWLCWFSCWLWFWLSVLVVLYQIITFDLSLLHGDDIDRKKGILIRDIMECLNDYQDFLIPANLNKLPRSFPDQQPDTVSNEHNSQDDVEMQEPFKLENIYALWKILCKKIK